MSFENALTPSSLLIASVLYETAIELYLKPLTSAGWTGIAKNITSSLPGSEPSTTTFFLSITRLFHVFPSSRYPFLPDDDK